MKINFWSIFLLIAIIVIVLGLVNMEKKNYNKVPKKIWTYLESSDKMNKTQKLCIDSWKKYHPEYEVIILTRKTFKGYVTIPPEIYENPVFGDRMSELVRVWTLAENGGVWIEPNILFKESFDKWLFNKYGEFSGFISNSYTTNKDYPFIENWFFACNKNSKIMKLWRDEYSEIAKFVNVEKYIESRKGYIDFGNINYPIDFAQYISLQKVLQMDKYPLDSLILRVSEEGPMKYLVDAKWNSEKAVNLACIEKKYQTPLIRFRDEEIKFLERNIDIF